MTAVTIFPMRCLEPTEVATSAASWEGLRGRKRRSIKKKKNKADASCSHVRFTWIDEMVRHPKILDAWRTCWGRIIPVLEHQLLPSRTPVNPGFVSWHHVRLLVSHLVRCLTRLELDVAGEHVSGCMKFIA